ncbi:MAG: glycosyltransferase [Dehalococcoidia bacterium]|nr:glycosyltransferase [Dehalococcoidia bacterium]
MRILQVVHQFLPRYSGGTEWYVAGLSKGLRDRGHQVEILAGGDGHGPGFWEGMPVTTVPGGLRGTKTPAAGFLATFRNRATEGVFLDALRRFQPEVVHFHHLQGLSGRLPELARGRAATCFTLHDYWFRCPTSQLLDHRGRSCAGPAMGVNCSQCAAHRIGGGLWHLPLLAAAPVFAWRARVVPNAIALCDRLIAPSQFLADLAVRNGLPAAKLRTMDFGIAELPLSRQQWRPRPSGGKLRVAYIGSIHPSKGVDTLVDATAKVAPGLIEVSIAGEIAAYPEYARRLQAAATTLPVRFLGSLDRAGVAALLADSDVLCVPSRWYENSPLVVTEAFAMGVPVFASDIGALAEKVGDGAGGLLHPPGDSAALARLLEQAATQPGLMPGLRHSIRPVLTRAGHHTAMEEVYSELRNRTTVVAAS